MSSDTAFNSNTSSSDHTRDEEDLKALNLAESDLERFASYFELAFQGSCEGITVLAALLQRLCKVEKLRQQKQSGIWIEDIVGRLTHRLYTRCGPGLEAAARFGGEASDMAERIFAEGVATHSEL